MKDGTPWKTSSVLARTMKGLRSRYPVQAVENTGYYKLKKTGVGDSIPSLTTIHDQSLKLFPASRATVVSSGIGQSGSLASSTFRGELGFSLRFFSLAT